MYENTPTFSCEQCREFHAKAKNSSKWGNTQLEAKKKTQEKLESVKKELKSTRKQLEQLKKKRLYANASLQDDHTLLVAQVQAQDAREEQLKNQLSEEKALSLELKDALQEASMRMEQCVMLVGTLRDQLQQEKITNALLKNQVTVLGQRLGEIP